MSAFAAGAGQGASAEQVRQGIGFEGLGDVVELAVVGGLVALGGYRAGPSYATASM